MIETLSPMKEVKAQKEHKCGFCGAKINVGETYVTSTHKYKGSVYDFKSHVDCQSIARRLDMYRYASDEGLTGEDFQETIHCQHDDILRGVFSNEERERFKDVIRQLGDVTFKSKLAFVIRYYNNLDKPKEDMK